MSLADMVELMVWVIPVIVPMCIAALFLAYALEIVELGDDIDGN